MACFLSRRYQTMRQYSGSPGVSLTLTQWDSCWHCGFLSQRSLLHSQQRVLITSSQSNWIYDGSSVLSQSKVLEQVQQVDEDKDRDLSLVSLFCACRFFLTSLKYNFSFVSLFSQAHPNVEAQLPVLAFFNKQFR